MDLCVKLLLNGAGRLVAASGAGGRRGPGAVHVSGTKVELRHDPLLETRFRFWEDNYQKYYMDPIPSPAPEV